MKKDNPSGKELEPPTYQFIDYSDTGRYLGQDSSGEMEVKYCLDGVTVSKEAFVDGVIAQGFAPESARGTDPETWWDNVAQGQRGDYENNN